MKFPEKGSDALFRPAGHQSLDGDGKNEHPNNIRFRDNMCVVLDSGGTSARMLLLEKAFYMKKV